MTTPSPRWSASARSRPCARRHRRRRFLPRQRPAGARPGARRGRCRLPVPGGARSQLRRSRSLRQARRLNMVPSDLSGDTEFLRRVTIDTHRLPADAGRSACLPGRQGPEQARQEDRRAAGSSAARRAVGDQVLRHHRQQHRRAGDSRSEASAARCGTTGSANGSPTTCPTTRSSRACSAPPAATARTPEDGSRTSRKSTRQSRRASITTYADRAASICSGGGRMPTCRSSSGAKRRRPRSSAFAWNVPSATSTRSTAGPRPTTARSRTSFRR